MNWLLMPRENNPCAASTNALEGKLLMTDEPNPDDVMTAEQKAEHDKREAKAAPVNKKILADKNLRPTPEPVAAPKPKGK